MRNQRIVLREHLHGTLTRDTFASDEVVVPAVGDGEVLVRNTYISLDPYVRNRLVRMNSYAVGVELGDVIVGETVGTVIDSRSALVPTGSTVIGFGGWQDYYIVEAKQVRVLPAHPDISPSMYLSAMGMPGLTAWTCLIEIAHLTSDDTLVVPAASGPVGLLLGQIGKIIGARCVGVVGNQERAERLRNKGIFDVVIDRRARDFPAVLNNACPSGIDVYVDTVGGEVLTTVLEHMNVGGRIPLVGTIADYDELSAPGPVNLRPAFTRAILVKRLNVRGVLEYDHRNRRSEFEHAMEKWIRQGDVHLEEEVHRGLESAPSAFQRLLAGEHSAKIVVEL